MKKIKFVCVALCAFLAGFSSLYAGGKKDSDSRKNTVVVYTYDSFASEWGPGPELVKRFEEATGYKLDLVNCGDAIQALNKAVLEKNKVQADIVLGIDNSCVKMALDAGILDNYTAKDSDKIIDSSISSALGGNELVTAFDYGHFAIIWDSASSLPAPKSLEDLTSETYAKKIILMDPRTSTPGLGFLAWTVSLFGDSYKDYWEKLRPNILSMTTGWSEGWGMFLKGEAPLVISYTTSPAYCIEYDKTDRYKTLLFDQGHIMQVEGLALLKNAPNPEGAKAFIDFMISAKAQETLPLTQWMYPVNKEVSLPASYSAAVPELPKTLSSDSARTQSAIEDVIKILGK